MHSLLRKTNIRENSALGAPLLYVMTATMKDYYNLNLVNEMLLLFQILFRPVIADNSQRRALWTKRKKIKGGWSRKPPMKPHEMSSCPLLCTAAFTRRSPALV